MSRLVTHGRRRQSGFQGSAFFSLALTLVAIVGVAWVYTGTVTREHWPIRWLEIDGGFQRVSAEQMRGRLAPLVAKSYFSVDLQEVRAAASRHPWVSAVTVQKHWPDRVRVSITEFVPAAHWNRSKLVSTAGEVFEAPGDESLQGLPWLEGPEQNLGEVFDAWRRFNNLLLPVGLEIERLTLDPRGAWSLLLTNGTDVQIGRGDPLVRLRRLVSSWPLLAERQLGLPLKVDLRYTNGLAVRWPDKDERYGKES